MGERLLPPTDLRVEILLLQSSLPQLSGSVSASKAAVLPGAAAHPLHLAWLFLLRGAPAPLAFAALLALSVANGCTPGIFPLPGAPALPAVIVPPPARHAPAAPAPPHHPRGVLHLPQQQARQQLIQPRWHISPQAAHLRARFQVVVVAPAQRFKQHHPQGIHIRC